MVGGKWVKPEPSQFSTFKCGLFTPMTAESDTWVEVGEGSTPTSQLVRFQNICSKFPNGSKSPEEHRLEFYSKYIKA